MVLMILSTTVRLLEISCNLQVFEVLKSQLVKVSVHFSASVISYFSEVTDLSCLLKTRHFSADQLFGIELIELMVKILTITHCPQKGLCVRSLCSSSSKNSFLYVEPLYLELTLFCCNLSELSKEAWPKRFLSFSSWLKIFWYRSWK